MKMTKKWGYVAGACLTGMLLSTILTGCQSSESKTGAVESQKARDMKEADKAATEYMKAYIDMDKKKMNELLIDEFKGFKGEGVTNPGASDKLKGRYELFRYDLEEGSNEYYYKARFYHPVKGGQSSVSLRMMKDKKDGKWKNHSWAWEDLHNLESIVGDTKPVQVHKWEGERE